MEDSIRRIRTQFEAKPLFHEEALNHELQIYEQRQRSSQLQQQAQREKLLERARTEGRVDVPTIDTSLLTPYRALALKKAASVEKELKTTLPAPIQRPWSVQRLLKIGHEINNTSYFSPIKKAPMRQHYATPLQNEVEVAARHMAVLTEPLPDDPYWEGVSKDSQNRKQWRKSNSANHRRVHGNITDEEHDYKFNGNYYTSQGALEARGARRPANLTDASSLRTYDRDELIAINGEDSDRGSSIFDYESETTAKEKKLKTGGRRKDIPENFIEAHIERAAARKALQESRLQALGIRAPNSQLEIATQVDLNGDGSGVTDETIATILGINRSSQKPLSKQDEKEVLEDLSRHTAQYSSAPQPIVLEPQGQFTQRRSGYPIASSTNTDTVWQAVLNEEKRLAAQQNAHESIAGSSTYQLPSVSNTWLNIVQSSSNANGFIPTSMKKVLSSDVQGTSQSQVTSSQPPISLPNRGGILRQIDQMQLANEEMLIRNKVIQDPLPSSVGGAFNIKNGILQQNPDEMVSRNVISHVAAAHNDPQAQEAAFSKYRPIGGYGSVTDPNSRSKDDESSRWINARHQNEKKQLMTSESEPLRAWATALPTNFLGSLSESGPSLNIHMNQGKRALGIQENAARKKWGDVTFTNPNQHNVAPGIVEGLSGKARNAMFPDAAFS